MKISNGLSQLGNSVKEKKQSFKKFYYITLLFGILGGTVSCDKKLDNSTKLPNHRIESILSEYDKEFDVQLKKDQESYRNYGDLYAGYLGYFEKSDTGDLSFGKVQMSDTLKIKGDANTIMHTLWKKNFKEIIRKNLL